MQTCTIQGAVVCLTKPLDTVHKIQNKRNKSKYCRICTAGLTPAEGSTGIEAPCRTRIKSGTVMRKREKIAGGNAITQRMRAEDVQRDPQ